ncbi:MAG: hypothetical protein KDM81_16835, partial [Verrucomicrobiae bacterium]|nr:hypothetical protein [Verrucomicrobiae bacterium]
LIVEHPDCDHDFPPDIRERAYQLLDATLRPPDQPSRFSARTAPLAERFAQPPAANRILKIIHGWPDAAAAQDRLRERLLDQGFGGVVCNVAFDQYLESEPQWAAFVRAATAARQAGMALWLYDERGYPSGNAGGLVLRDHPEWEAAGMLTVDKECGPGPVSLTVPPGDLVLAVAFPLPAGAGPVIPSAEPVSLPLPADGRIEWTAPAGRWRLLVVTRNRLYEGTHADGNLWQKMPYVNLLQAAPTERFIEVTHHRYARHFDGRLGDWFEATFTDEPSLMSMFFQRMPWRPLPWSAELPAEFRRRRGYDLAPLLPDLLLAEAGPDAARHRHDFWQTIGELVSENYFGQIETACRTLGLPSGGHLLAFSAPRTYHRMAVAIEDAGFEIRDSILNAVAGDARVLRFLESLSEEQARAFLCCIEESGFGGLLSWVFGSGFPKSHDVGSGFDRALYGPYLGEDEPMPQSMFATHWQGWGTALKPAFEPIVVARKPLAGTVAGNVAAHGCGALNIDG